MSGPWAGISVRRLDPLGNKERRLRRFFPLLARLPRRLAYGIASGVGRRDVDNRRGYLYRDLVAAGEAMCQVFPALRDDPARLRHYLRLRGAMIARDSLDGYYMPRFRSEPAAGFLAATGLEHLAAAGAAGRGTILVLSHFGRLCMLGPVLGLNGVAFCTLTADVRAAVALDAVDREFTTTKLANAVAFGKQAWLTTSGSPRPLYRALTEGKTVLVAMDGGSTGTARLTFPFLGGTLSLPTGILRLAQATGARLVYASAADNPATGGVTASIHPLPDDPAMAVERAVTILEQDIRRWPWQWAMWAVLPALWRGAASPMPPGSFIPQEPP